MMQQAIGAGPSCLPCASPAMATASARAHVGAGDRSVLSLPARRPRALQSKVLRVSAVDSATATPEKVAPAILLTDKASNHLKKLRTDNDSLCLRVGVKQGGCSGMSYVMDFEDQSKLRPDDSLIEAGEITLVCDPKSLLFLFGMQLDYSDALIGGGFSFNNPNATSSCGCGKSFAA